MNTEHIIQIGVSVDDDAIIRSAVNAATKELMKLITETYISYPYGQNHRPKPALEEIISEKADKFIEQQGDFILNLVADKVVEKLMRSKKMKDVYTKIEAEVE